MHISRVPRVRMFAGPNGSGKSKLLALVRDRVNLYQYINADDIEAALKSTKGWELPAPSF